MSRRNSPPEENNQRTITSKQCQQHVEYSGFVRGDYCRIHGKRVDTELDDELDYIKYDYKNKGIENSRNGYSKKTFKTSFEIYK